MNIYASLVSSKKKKMMIYIYSCLCGIQVGALSIKKDDEPSRQLHAAGAASPIKGQIESESSESTEDSEETGKQMEWLISIHD